MNSQTENQFEVVLNKSGNSLNGRLMDGKAVKSAIENFNATRGIACAELGYPNLNLYSDGQKLLRMLEIRLDNQAAVIGDLKFNGDEGGEWEVRATVRPTGPFAEVVVKLHKENNLCFGMRALHSRDEIQIINWDVIDPAKK